VNALKTIFVQSETESLAVEWLSSVLKSHGHKTALAFDPRLFDGAVLHNDYLKKKFDITEQLVKEIKYSRPNLVAFSVMTGNYQWALTMAKSVKRELEVPIIFGGVHPTLVPEIVIKNDCVDLICVGEGEHALVELAESLDRKKPNYKIRNLWFKHNGKIIRNDLRPPIQDLDTIPFPDKDLFYRQQRTLERKYVTMATRGCPFTCTFCCNYYLRKPYIGKGRFVRRRNVQNFIDELVWMKSKYKARYVDFADDVFTFNVKWMEEFSKRYKAEIDLPFSCITHPNMASRKIIKLLKEAGCYWLMIGVQSVSEHTRRNILNRRETNEQIQRVARECHKIGLHFSCDHIFNIPSESEREQIEALHFYNEIRPSIINTYWLKYYPQTEILETARKIGILDDHTIEKIAEGKMSTSHTVGIGAKDTFNLEKRYYNFAFWMNILPFLPKSLMSKIIEKKWFLTWFKSPIWLNTIIKFVRRISIKHHMIYTDEIRFQLHNIIQNRRILRRH